MNIFQIKAIYPKKEFDPDYNDIYSSLRIRFCDYIDFDTEIYRFYFFLL